MEGEKEVSVDSGGDEKEDGEKEEEAVVRDGEKEESGEENGDALNLIGGVEPIWSGVQLRLYFSNITMNFCLKSAK